MTIKVYVKFTLEIYLDEVELVLFLHSLFQLLVIL